MGWHGAATEHGNAASMVRTETTVQRRQLLLSIADRGLAPMPLDISTLIRPGCQKIPVDETAKRKLMVTLGLTFKGSAEILEAHRVPFPQRPI